MGTRNDSQCTVGLVSGIKMQTNCEHSLEDLDWRLDVQNPTFFTPWTKAWHILALIHSYRQVLMPRHKPIGLCAFIKVDGSHRKGFGIEIRSDEAQDLIRMREIGDAGLMQQSSPTSTNDRRKRVEERLALPTRDSLRNPGETVAFHLRIPAF